MATLSFSNGNGCNYSPVSSSDVTTITSVTPSGDPAGRGYWRTHPDDWSNELLARVQATDQRYDGADGSAPDGMLAVAEVEAVLTATGQQPHQLLAQALATYLNLADRRINAETRIASATAARWLLDDVADAAHFGQQTLGQPVDRTTRDRYSDATTVLDEINNNQSEVY